MRIVTCQQGDATWHASRAGVITASMFRVARSRKKNGERTDEALNYAFRLAIERISGSPLDGGFETWQMRRGQELEADARIAHQADIGEFVEPVGMVLSDDGNFGASADGWIRNDGGAEYKCLIAPDELRTVLIEHDLKKFDDQVFGNLWLSGRSWWDFALYCPALKAIGKDFFRWRIQRDETYIDAMVEDLMDFDKLVDQNVAELRKLAA